MTAEIGGIGARLRAGREKLGLTVLQAAEKLHVDARILESLESENFEALGAQVFARGHLRHYAELVGESVSQLNELYSHAAGSAQPDLTRIAKAPSSDSSKLIFPALVVLSVFAVAGAVWWVLSLSPNKAQTNEIGPVASTPDTDSASGTDLTSPAEVPPTPPATVERGISPASKGLPAKGPASKSVEPKGLAVPGGQTQSGDTVQPRNSMPPTRFASAAAPGAVTDTSSGAAAPAGATAHADHDEQITLHFSADSWTEVYDASGARLFYDVGAADTMRTLKGRAPLRIVLGNAAGVMVEVNGHSTPITKLSQPDGSAQFLINRTGRAVRAHSAAGGD
ncbi:MAG: RodZ domain-containing protein [Steroidobacteraceae bacterium]